MYIHVVSRHFILLVYVLTRACKKTENFKVDPIEFSTFFRGFWPEKPRILKANPTRPVPELRVSGQVGYPWKKVEFFSSKKSYLSHLKYQYSPEILCRLSRDSLEILQRFCWDSVEILQRFSRDSPEILQRFSRDSPEILQRFSRDYLEIL